MKVLNGFILGLFFVLLVGILAFTFLMAFTERVRERALKKLMGIAKTNNIPVSPIYVKRQLDRLNIKDLKILDDWTTALDKKDYPSAIAMWPDVRIALQKTDLGIVFGGLGTLLGMAS